MSFSDVLRFVQMLKRESGVRKQREATAPIVFIPFKTTTLVPEFSVEHVPLDRTVTLVPAFTVKDLSLDRIRW